VSQGPMVVGLTGGIGSGKSLAVSFFRDLGAQGIVADDLVGELLGSRDVLDELRSVFGAEVVGADAVDRRVLADLVFSDGAARRRLEMILHPRVAALAARALADAWSKNSPVVIYEVPLLIEIGAHEWVDQVLVVRASESVRVRRLVTQRGSLEEDALARIRAQVPDHELAGAWILENDGTREDLRHQVEVLYRRCLSRVRKTPGPGGMHGEKEQ